MSESVTPRTRPKPPIADAYKVWYWWYEESQTTCSICGEEMQVGQHVIEVPFDGNSLMDVTVHLGCAINGDEVDLAQLADLRARARHRRDSP